MGTNLEVLCFITQLSVCITLISPGLQCLSAVLSFAASQIPAIPAALQTEGHGLRHRCSLKDSLSSWFPHDCDIYVVNLTNTNELG